MHEHVRGSIAVADSPNGRSQSITEIRARCNVSEQVPDYVGQDAHVNFGPRWNNLKCVRFGSQEALMTIELPEAFRVDLEHYRLHPAVLDMAGAAHALIKGYNRLEDFYLPFSYGKIRVNAHLPAKLFSHIRHREQENSKNGIAVFDITILDEDGKELVEISDFVLRKITAAAVTAGEGEPFRGLPSDLGYHIQVADGVKTFARLLSLGRLPQIVVAPKDLNTLMEPVSAIKDRPDWNGDGQTQAVLAQHPRPELPTTYIPPGTEPERQITQIWQELLGIQQVGIYDDFFELGGNSLLIVTIHSKVQQTFGVTFPVANMFQYPTVSSLANYVDQLIQGQGSRPSSKNLHERAQRQREALNRQRQLVNEKRRDDR
jgi:polyketide synthase PksJ